MFGAFFNIFKLCWGHVGSSDLFFIWTMFGQLGASSDPDGTISKHIGNLLLACMEHFMSMLDVVRLEACQEFLGHIIAFCEQVGIMVKACWL